MWNCYLRWRHTRGFGVHSPYAYKLICDVINPGKYGHYAYHEADVLIDSSHCSPRLGKLIRFIIRLAVFLKSIRIVTPSESLPAQIAASSLNIEYSTVSSKNFSFLSGDFLVLDSDCDPGTVRETIDKKIPILALSPSSGLRNILCQPLKKGLLLKSPGKIILIPRDEMEYLTYDINL